MENKNLVVSDDRTKRLLSSCFKNDSSFYSKKRTCWGKENKDEATSSYFKDGTDFFYPIVNNETGISDKSLHNYIYDGSLASKLTMITNVEISDTRDVKKTYATLTNVNETDVNQTEEDFNSDDSLKDPDYVISQEDKDEFTYFDDDQQEEAVSHASNIDENETNSPPQTANNILQRFKTKMKNTESKKLLRNCGKEYDTKSGKKIKARTPRPLKANCRRHCKNKISDEDRLLLFEDYWKMGTYDRRVTYIASLIQVANKKTATVKRDTINRPERNREKTFNYFVEIRSERVPCCKECFLAIFDETNKFILSVTTKKISSLSGIPASDLRGRHAPKNKISNDRLQFVIDHISKFPAYESHYSRRHTGKKYLASDLSKSKMYELYCDEATDTPVSFKIYSQAIDKLNLKFKKPSNDTCATCDILQNKIKSCTDTKQRQTNQYLLEEHHQEADMTYDAKKADKARCLDSKTEKIFVFDLQQVLPTPFLTTGTVFYKRQLHTYNVSINDCSSKITHHFMWHEAIAGRGANEIASCLFKFFDTLPLEVEHVTLYSDTCGGQNKNSYVAAMCTYFLNKSEHLKVIDHKFLVPGHTHLECDSDHARIEKFKKKCPFPIHVPRDWYNLVRLAGKKTYLFQ